MPQPREDRQGLACPGEEEAVSYGQRQLSSSLGCQSIPGASPAVRSHRCSSTSACSPGQGVGLLGGHTPHLHTGGEHTPMSAHRDAHHGDTHTHAGVHTTVLPVQPQQLPLLSVSLGTFPAATTSDQHQSTQPIPRNNHSHSA